MSVARMNDVRVGARKSLGKGANLRRSSPLEQQVDLMAYGRPAGDPQVTADLNAIRVWQRKLNTGTLVWPLDESVWEPALNKGRGRGPIRHLKMLANRAGWVPHPQGRQCGKQVFTWQDAESKRPDFAVGETCVRWQAEPEDLSHIFFHCPHWHKERRDVELPADDDTTPPCVKLHGILPAPRVPPVITHEPVLVCRTGVVTVWTDASGRHSADPHDRRCGVGYYKDTQEHVWLPLPGLRQSVYRADFLAVVRALEECQPHEVVSDCKGVVKAVQALQQGRRTPKGRQRPRTSCFASPSARSANQVDEGSLETN
eukprot:3377168-Amphidinium_carterae.1